MTVLSARIPCSLALALVTLAAMAQAQAPFDACRDRNDRPIPGVVDNSREYAGLATMQKPTYFLGLVGINSFSLSASATAVASKSTANPCIYELDPSSTKPTSRGRRKSSQMLSAGPRRSPQKRPCHRLKRPSA